MNNQEALIAGVQAWMDANKDIVLQTYHKAVRESSDEAALMISTQIAARIGRWLNENAADLKAGIALQFSLNQLETDPRIIERIKKQLELTSDPAITDTGERPDGDGN